jgi:hypothetical protein
MQVIATQKGYYGSKVREAGERFTLSDEAHLGSWMKAVEPAADPLDHDGDGRKGGSKSKAQEKDTEVKPPVEPAKAKDAVTGDDI